MIELEHCSVDRGSSRVVDDVSLTVGSGEWIGLIGPNGAGKSTLLEAIAGLVHSTGCIMVDGHDLGELSVAARARRVALVPQSPIMPSGMPVIDYVMLGRAPHLGRFGAESELDIAVANTALDQLHLIPFARRSVDELSGGEKQRVVIARALAQSTSILLLDEPTSALDVGVRMEVLDHIDSIRRDRGLTVVSAVHDLTLAAQFCDRLVMLAGGAVVAQGAPEAVLTADTIGRHYGARVRVISDDGGVIVVPIRRRTAPDSTVAERIGDMEPHNSSSAHV